jgi:hypothetical protein
VACRLSLPFTSNCQTVSLQHTTWVTKQTESAGTPTHATVCAVPATPSPHLNSPTRMRSALLSKPGMLPMGFAICRVKPT